MRKLILGLTLVTNLAWPAWDGETQAEKEEGDYLLQQLEDSPPNPNLQHRADSSLKTYALLGTVGTAMTLCVSQKWLSSGPYPLLHLGVASAGTFMGYGILKKTGISPIKSAIISFLFVNIAGLAKEFVFDERHSWAYIPYNIIGSGLTLPLIFSFDF